jgi:hypothetical protein
MDKTLLTESYNFHAVKTGLAYLGLYSGGLSLDIQDDLIAIYQEGKKCQQRYLEARQNQTFYSHDISRSPTHNRDSCISQDF